MAAYALVFTYIKNREDTIMTFDGYTITLTQAEIKQMFETKPRNTGRMWYEYVIEHTFMTDTYDVYINMSFYTFMVEHGHPDHDPTLDTSWQEEVADAESIEFEIWRGENDGYELSEESVNEIKKQLNDITF